MVDEIDILLDVDSPTGFCAADIAWGRPASARSVAAQLCSMRRRGLVTSADSRPTVWKITEAGKRALGPQVDGGSGE